MGKEKKKIKVPVIKPKKERDGKVKYKEMCECELAGGMKEKKKKLEKVERDTIIAEILVNYPELAQILIDNGLFCVGCPAASFESLENGCKMHQISDEKIDEIVKKMNEEIKKIGGKKKSSGSG
ncbi:MAG: DUF1858 domain-containing protein [Candidatus Micrarchaeota archaeon]